MKSVWGILHLSKIVVLTGCIISVGGSETNQEIVSRRAVRARVPSGCKVEVRLKRLGPGFPFSLFPQEVFPFPLRDYGKKQLVSYAKSK